MKWIQSIKQTGNLTSQEAFFTCDSHVKAVLKEI